MAVVYRAVDETLGREVAIKVLHGHLLAEAESKARLQREAQAVAKLQHDNIVQIFDYSGPTSSSAFIVTEFIEGQTLKQWLAARQVPYPELAALVLVEVAGAVAHAHGLGILHRDIKPENVMLRRDGVVKLMDFGVAQVMDLERMTVTGQLIGSPAYMAPELIEGRTVDFRTDVFALGIMLYQLATGALPFAGRNPHEVFKRITDARYPDPRSKNPLIGAQFTKIIARALAREPVDRYPTAQAFMEDLRTFAGQAGLRDARSELAEAFGDYEAYIDGVKGRMLRGLTEAGREALAEKRAALAIELWNRALALDPQFGPALEAVRALEQGQRLRKTLVAGGAAVTLAGGIYLVFQLVPAPGSTVPATPLPVEALAAKPNPPPAKAKPAPAPPATAEPPTPAVAVAQPTSPASPPAPIRRQRQVVRPALPQAAPSPEPTGDPPAAPAPVRFTLGPTPPAVEVYLDGVKQFDFGPEQNSLDVPWEGVHVVEFRKPGFYPVAVKVGPTVNRPVNNHITARLQGRPASLSVKVEPAGRGARILVATPDTAANRWQAAAVSGQPLHVPFELDDEIHKRLVITVMGADDRLVNREVTLIPGEKKSVSITLP